MIRYNSLRASYSTIKPVICKSSMFQLHQIHVRIPWLNCVLMMALASLMVQEVTRVSVLLVTQEYNVKEVSQGKGYYTNNDWSRG